MPAETHVEQGPLDRQEVFELIRDRLADILEIEPVDDQRGRLVRRRPRRRLPGPDRAGRGPRGGAGRAHRRVPHRGRGPRGPEDGARRRRLRRRPRRRGTADPRVPIPSSTRSPERLGVTLRRPRRCWLGARPTARGAPRTPAYESNERLEFLGDAVLGLVVTDHVFRAYPTCAEGELAKVRRPVVSAATLAEVADELELGDAPAARQGRGRSPAGGRSRRSWPTPWRRCIGAVYLDAGWAAAARPRAAPARRPDRRGARRRPGRPGLQDPAAGAGRPALRARRRATRSLAEGPDHAKRFHATVAVGGERRGTGEGRSKKQAEQAAARRERLTPTLPGRAGDATDA